MTLCQKSKSCSYEISCNPGWIPEKSLSNYVTWRSLLCILNLTCKVRLMGSYENCLRNCNQILEHHSYALKSKNKHKNQKINCQVEHLLLNISLQSHESLLQQLTPLRKPRFRSFSSHLYSLLGLQKAPFSLHESLFCRFCNYHQI